MSEFDKQKHALLLRSKGKSIKEIAEQLSVSKSSASVWCRNVLLTDKQRDALNKKMISAGRAGRLKGALQNKLGKEKRIKEAEAKAEELLGYVNPKDNFLIGLGLYWGEGTKTDQSTTSFINSDPRAVRFMLHWFRDSFGITNDRFNPYITLTEPHRGRELVVKEFWAKELGLPLEQFRKVIYIKTPHKKVYENHDLYYGTVALRIRCSANLRYLIRGLLKRVYI